MDVGHSTGEKEDQGIRKCLIGLVIVLIIGFAVLYSISKTPEKECMNPSKITKLVNTAWRNSPNPIIPCTNFSIGVENQISVLGFSHVTMGRHLTDCEVKCVGLTEVVVRCNFTLENLYFVTGENNINMTACGQLARMELKLEIKNGTLKTETSFVDPNTIRTEPCVRRTNSNSNQMRDSQIKDIIKDSFERGLKNHITDKLFGDTSGDLWSK